MWDSNGPITSLGTRDQIFFEAKNLVNDQFPDASEASRMQLIGDLVRGYSTLVAGQYVGDEVSRVLVDISGSIREAGER